MAANAHPAVHARLRPQLSPTMVNDLSAHYTRFNFKAVYPQQVVQPSTVGFDISPQDPAYATLPTIPVAGHGASRSAAPQRSSTPHRPGHSVRRQPLQDLRKSHAEVRLRWPPLQRLQRLRRQEQWCVRFRLHRHLQHRNRFPRFLLGIPVTYGQGTTVRDPGRCLPELHLRSGHLEGQQDPDPQLWSRLLH